MNDPIDYNPRESTTPIAPGSEQPGAGGEARERAPKERQKPAPAPAPKLTSFMAQWFRQYHKFTTAAVCVLIFLGGYAFLLMPAFSRGRLVAGAEFAKASATRSQLSEQLSYLKRLSGDSAQAVLGTLADIEAFLPDEPATPQILTSIEAIALSSGVAIDGIELVIPEDDAAAEAAGELGLPSGISFVEVTLAVAASSYDSLKTLLANIEANIRLMDVIAVVYSPSSKSYTITLRAYYLLPE
ncbi:MAG: hypothetical protein AAB671_00175 [Patescibacteria group bacterium]